MIVSVLLNNYNYGRFVGAALESVLAQTRPAEEIIVVDDGSTDDSLAVLDAFQGRHPALRIIAKANAGQLSCFNVAVAAATGDLLFFLDADDEYAPTYLERALAVYRARPNCGFLFCAYQRFGQADGIHRVFSGTCELGLSMAVTKGSLPYYGSVTSAHSMRREVAARYLPIPLENEWRVRADDCLTWGSSLAGADKCYLDEPLVRYRVHHANHFYGRPVSAREIYAHRVRTDRLMRHFDDALCLPPSAGAYCGPEFLCKPRPRGTETHWYLRAVWFCRTLTILKKLLLSWTILRHFHATRRQPDLVIPDTPLKS